MNAQVIYELGTGGVHDRINGEVLTEDPKVVRIVTAEVSHYIPWARVVRIVEAHPNNEEDNQ